MRIVDKGNMSSIVGKIRKLIKTTSQNTLNAGKLIFQPREAGKGLSSNDFTDADKTKLDKIIFIDIPEDFPDSPTPEQFVNSFGMTLRELYDKTNAGASVLVRCYIQVLGTPMRVRFPANLLWDVTNEYAVCVLSGWTGGFKIIMTLTQAGNTYGYSKEESEYVLTGEKVKQETGTSIVDVMSQYAVTNAINAGQPNLKLTGQIPTGPSVTQQQLNAIGLTATAMNNLFACKYNKVLIIEQAGVTEELFEYTWRIYVNRKELYFRYGDNFDVMQGYSIMYNANGTFNIKLGEI